MICIHEVRGSIPRSSTINGQECVSSGSSVCIVDKIYALVSEIIIGWETNIDGYVTYLIVRFCSFIIW